MTTVLSPKEWDRQFARQAGWTRATRAHLYRRANLLRAGRVLDVGCGTGTVTEEMALRTEARVTGIDLDPAMVAFSQARGGRAHYRPGDAHDLPFPDGWFDATVCHFLLMWCRDPVQAATEMVRVTRPGGVVLACAEPDYGGRIDHPPLPLVRWQVEALSQEGADPCMGRKLRGLFVLPGVRRIDVGLIPGLWDPAALRTEFDAEWTLWEHSLSELVPPDELANAKAADLEAIEEGTRFVFMPIFYAMARV
jgi:SAM-dependent methyltransferase